MTIFQWLKMSGLAARVRESLWAYPVLLSLHVVGLAIVVGILSVRDLQLTGCLQAPSPDAFLALGKFAWAGFVVNVISDVLLFVAQASTFVSSTPFLIKLGLIFTAAMLAAIVQHRLRAWADQKSQATVPGSLRALAGFSLTCWLGAIVAGRLIAYL